MRKLERGGIMSLQGEGRILARFSCWIVVIGQSDSEFGLTCQTVALYILFVFYLPPSVSFSHDEVMSEACIPVIRTELGHVALQTINYSVPSPPPQ